MVKNENAETISKKKISSTNTKTEKIATTPLNIFISKPNGKEPNKLKQEDVWGKWNEDDAEKISNGMIVASYNEVCPIFGDVVPYKSVTVVCDEKQVDDVMYWLEFVHGADCVEKTKNIGEGKVALRSNYQCW